MTSRADASGRFRRVVEELLMPVARFASLLGSFTLAVALCSVQSSALAGTPPAPACPAVSVITTRSLGDDDAPSLSVGRGILDDLRAARHAIDETYPLSTRAALMDARERLIDLGEPVPALVAPALSTGPSDIALGAPPVPGGWIPAGASLDTVQVDLRGVLVEEDSCSAPSEGSANRSRPSDAEDAGRIHTTALWLTIFPLAPLTADVNDVLRIVPGESARWHAARRIIDHALSLVKIIGGLRDAPLYDAYCDLFAAQRMSADDPVAARSSLRRAADRLSADSSFTDLARSIAALAEVEPFRMHVVDAASQKLYARITSRLCTTESSPP